MSNTRQPLIINRMNKTQHKPKGQVEQYTDVVQASHPWITQVECRTHCGTKLTAGHFRALLEYSECSQM